MACIGRNIVLAVLGNDLRGDDGAGILFGNLIREHTSLTVINGGNAPENITGLIVKKHPDTILIIDAMDFGGKPGDVKLVSSERLEKDAVSTHGSLKLFVEYLENMTGASIHILGFQPKNLGLGEEISPEVSESVRKTAMKIKDTASLSHTLKALKEE